MKVFYLLLVAVIVTATPKSDENKEANEANKDKKVTTTAPPPAATPDPKAAKVLGEMASAVLNAFFPPLPGEGAGNPPLQLPVQLETETATIAVPILQQAGAAALALPGVPIGQSIDPLIAPPVGHGGDLLNYAPAFPAISNAGEQDRLFGQSGIVGRTDLPANYIYPFAPPGAVVRPDQGSIESYALGADSLTRVAPRVVEQRQPILKPNDRGYLTEELKNNPVLQALNGDKTVFGDPIQQSKLPFAGSQQFWHESKTPKEEVQSPFAQQLSNNVLRDGFGRPIQPPDQSIGPNIRASVPVELPSSASRQQLLEIQQVREEEYRRQQEAILQEQLRQQQFTANIEKNLQLQPAVNSSRQLPTASSRQFHVQHEAPVGVPASDADRVPSIMNFVAATEAERRHDMLQKQESTRAQELCLQCVPVSLEQIAGAWTQVYGNRDSLRGIYTTLNSLQHMDDIDDEAVITMQPMSPSCVGMILGDPLPQSTTANLFYRDDSPDRTLFEFKGMLHKDTENKTLSLRVPGLDMPVCTLSLDSQSPSQSAKVLILTETTGERRCRAMHVFTRDVRSFWRSYHQQTADWLARSVEYGRLPVSALPLPNLCELPGPTRHHSNT